MIASESNVSEQVRGSNTRARTVATLHLHCTPRYDRVPLMLCQSVLIEWCGCCLDNMCIPCITATTTALSPLQCSALAQEVLATLAILPTYHTAAIIMPAFYSTRTD